VSTHLTPAFFESLVDFPACNDRVRTRLATLADDTQLLRFFAHYASWNGHFANGVSALTSMIGAERELFREPGFPRAVSDRSNFIASHFFDAARDEYDDHINPLRDSHRCLAQASLVAMAEILGTGEVLDEPEPVALQRLNEAVLSGYTGQPANGEGRVDMLFFGMGYHLGSELLADREFSMIDEHLRAQHNDLVQQLMRKTVSLAGADHRCYAWIGVHSGHGGGVEADHFDFAARGTQEALKYLPSQHQTQAMQALKRGFIAFSEDHRAFFSLG